VIGTLKKTFIMAGFPAGLIPREVYPPTQNTTVFETVDEYTEGTLRSSYERSGVCFGGFRLPAQGLFGEDRADEACGGATGFSPWGSTCFS
jgi:hypothetical protein